MKAPPIGSIWRHLKSDHLYIVLGTSMIESTWRPGVRYIRLYDADGVGDIVRDLEEFLDGRFVQIDPETK